MAEREDLPLTIDNICRELQGVNSTRLAVWLRVPHKKLDEIKQQHSTQADLMRAIVEYWLSVDPTPSWRRLVWALEGSSQALVPVVDTVKTYVEPLTDPSLTAENVSSVLESVMEWKKVYFILGVPLPKQQSTEPERPTVKPLSLPEQRQRAVSWWLRYSPTASWTWLAGRLYSMKEKRAVEAVSRYFPKKPTDSTLNPANLFSALSNVRNWFDELPIGLRFELQVPESVVDEIQEQTDDATRQKKTLIKRWLRDYPAPSWAVVAEALYKIEEHRVLEQVKKKYITTGAK